MRGMQRKILEILQLERDRWVLWTPVCFGAGIGWYFALLQEPAHQAIAVAAGISLLAVLAAVIRRWRIWPLLAVIALFASGAYTAVWRTESVAAPILQKQDEFAIAEGKVLEIVPRERDTRLLLSEVKLEGHPPEETPAKVSVTLKGTAHTDMVMQGDIVRVKAGFFPPPMAAYPDSYQFNRHYYFQGIGATGYSFGSVPPEVLKRATEEAGFMASVERIRQRIFALFMKEMGSEAGAVAAALTMGEQRAIPAHVFDAMRDSGLAHILSISGLHMALAAGIFFFGVRLALTFFPAVALRFNTKKLAAGIALLGALAYLFLSGMPIPAQRSYLMIMLVLLAVAFDRQVTPMRSLALAAMAVLIFAPESLLNPSFQLSFAATLGLVAYYEYWRERSREEEGKPKRKGKFLRYWLDIIATSVVATFMTTPFILHHFEGFPIYSVLGNMLTLGLVSFFIMPLIVLTLLLLPFGLEEVLILPLKYGVLAMIAIGEWVSSLPSAVITTPPLGVWWLALCAIGGLWLCIWRGKWRHLGWLGIAIAGASLFFYQPPDIIIGEDGKKLTLRTGFDEMTMLLGRTEGFQQEQWRRFALVDEFVKPPKKGEGDNTLRCDAHGCRYAWSGKTVAVVYDREALEEDCGQSDVVIVPEWSVYKGCGARMIDRRMLMREGATAIWLEDEIRSRSVREMTGERPWSRSITSQR